MKNFTLASSGFNFETIPLPDERLKYRLQKVLTQIEKKPAASFPSIFKGATDLTGFYRLMNNQRINHTELFKNAFSVTQEKSKQHSKIIAIHDTSHFILGKGASPHISGIGRLTGKNRGFFGHFCLAVTPHREALGLLGFKHYVRPQTPIGKRSHVTRKKDTQCESHRWYELIQQTQNLLPEHPCVIHVADREADDYVSYSRMLDENIRFVFRVQHNRNILGQEEDKLFESLKVAQIVCEREVAIPRRNRRRVAYTVPKVRPPREARTVQLGIAAQRVEICKSTNLSGKLPKSIFLNFVVVSEINPPQEETPISWMLVTSEPIERNEQLLEIIDTYRARWSIEEYFKALKSGCSYEDRQFESIEAFLRCLALLAVVACNVYNIKMLDREAPEKNVQSICTPVQLQILKLRSSPNKPIHIIADFVRALAELGGHLTHNGKPGWQVLMRGYEELLKLEEGWNLAQLTIFPHTEAAPQYV